MMTFKRMAVIGALSVSLIAHADNGGHVGGGDAQCEAKVKKFASNIQFWVTHGGPEVGPLNLSSSRNPETSQPYTFQ